LACEPLAVRQARVRTSPRHPRVVSPIELTDVRLASANVYE
jgi:hypothetical protein